MLQGTRGPLGPPSPQRTFPAPSEWLHVVEMEEAVLARGELKDLFIPELKQMHCWLKSCNYFPFVSVFIQSCCHTGSLTLIPLPPAPTPHPHPAPRLKPLGRAVQRGLIAGEVMCVARELGCLAVRVPAQLCPPCRTAHIAVRRWGAGLP